MPLKKLLTQSIAKKILTSFFLFSFLITTISVVIILYSQYDNEKSAIIKESKQLIENRTVFIAEVLWNFDLSLAKITVDSLIDYPSITYIAIMDKKGKVFTSAGNNTAEFASQFSVPLRHKDSSKVIGRLVGNITTRMATQHAEENLVKIIAIQAVKALLTSLVFLFLIYHFLIKHLQKITSTILLNSVDDIKNAGTLSLSRPYQEDELQLLADTLNNNRYSINAHINTINTKNKKLTKEINKRKKTESQLESNQKTLLHVLNSLTSAVFFSKKNGEVLFMNFKAQKLLNYHDAKKPQNNPLLKLNEILKFNEAKDFSSPQINITKLLETAGLINRHNLYFSALHDDSQHLVPMEVTIIPTKNDQTATSEENNFIIIIKDKSNQEKLLEMEHIVTHDYLTQVYNRMFLTKEMSSIIAKPLLKDYSLAIIDLDKFKAVNDTSGHQAGDALLKIVCQKIPNSLSSNDIFARIGGDEFAILFHNTAEESKEKARRIISDIENISFNYEGISHSISCSIGITSFRKSDKKIEAIMARADDACYQVKRQGKGNVFIYQENIIELNSDKTENERACDFV